MPNHFPAILITGNNKYNTVGDDIDRNGGGRHRPHDPRRRDAMHGVSTTPIPTTPPTTTPITTTPIPTTPTTTPTTTQTTSLENSQCPAWSNGCR